MLADIIQFMNALIPSFSVALTWSSGSATSMAFYQTALLAIGVAENVLIRVFVPMVQVYFLVSIMNPLADWRFTKFASLLRGLVRIGTKTLLAILIGHQGIQGLIMPALDGVKRSTVFRTASSLPGVGNLFGGVTDTVIGTGVLIKSAIGVGGLIAVCVICIAPILKLGVFTVVYRGLAAFAQPVTDRRIVSEHRRQRQTIASYRLHDRGDVSGHSDDHYRGHQPHSVKGERHGYHISDSETRGNFCSGVFHYFKSVFRIQLSSVFSLCGRIDDHHSCHDAVVCLVYQ